MKKITMPKNICGTKVETEEPLIEIAKDYVEILGLRIDVGFESFEKFAEYFNKLREFDKEREKLENELRILRLEKIKLDKYLEAKIAESVFLRDHIDGTERLSIQEGIYRDIRNRLNGIEED